MAGSIGGIACSNVKGTLPQGNNARVRIFHRPGAIGTGARITGWGGRSGHVKAILITTDLTSLHLWSASIQALLGNVVTVVNGNGTTYGGRLCTRVDDLEVSAAVGGLGQVRGEHDIEVVQV